MAAGEMFGSEIYDFVSSRLDPSRGPALYPRSEMKTLTQANPPLQKMRKKLKREDVKESTGMLVSSE